MSREKTIAIVSWLCVIILIAAFLGPVWGHFSTCVVGPFGGVETLQQVGILEWSARHWTNVSYWNNLPIFFPMSGSLGLADSLLGQAWLVMSVRSLFSPTVSGLYNAACLGSLLLAALGMAALWLASGGSRWVAGVAALAMIGAPYTHAQLGHLSQLPPPFVLFSLAALTAALRRQNAGLSTGQFWWLLAVGLVLQAAWGWHGFAYAVLGVAVLKTAWLAHRFRRKTADGVLFLSVLKKTILPFLAMVIAVWFLAQPRLQLDQQYPGFQRGESEIHAGSADLQHFLNRGVYRSGPSDWVGQGLSGAERYGNRERQVLHPGWLALVLFAVGWWRRGYLSFHRRRFGRALLVMGFIGLVLAFGESVGLPGTNFRLPLPFALLRKLVPPVGTFSDIWHFSWLMVVALAWWSAVGVEQLAQKYQTGFRRWAAPLVPLVLLFLLSFPAAVPSLVVPMDGRAGLVASSGGGVLTLPAPVFMKDEDRTEALWLLRSLTTGLPVTGGTSGWVPPEVRHLRSRISNCEEGRESAADLLSEMRAKGISRAEIALGLGDEKRVTFWRDALVQVGAVREDPWPQAGYEMYSF